MTSKLSSFAARLREHILSEGRIPRGTELVTSSGDWDSGNSSLRNDAVFNSLAQELFALQYSHNAAYQRICEARRVTPLTVSHWSQIPAVPTATFKELELTCLALAQCTHVFHSSGTTEQRPSRHFHNAESLAVYEDSLRTGFRRRIAENADLLLLSPSSPQAPRSSLVHMFETLRRDVGAQETVFVGHADADGSWRLNIPAACRVLDCAGRGHKPLIVLGTAFSFVQLLDSLETRTMRFQLPPGSRVMETGGYKGRSRSLPKAELHSLITERLGIPPSRIVGEYGMSELSSQAYDTDVPSDSRVFHFPPWVRTQILSPEAGCEVAEGETGLIRVFDLANVFSVMAIQTEDLGGRRGGGGFELIGRAATAEQRGCSLMAV